MIDVEAVPPDPILGLTVAFRADPRADKVNLGVGAYKTNEGKPLVLKAVHAAEQRMLEENFNHEYAPMTGVPSFNAGMLELLFGPNPDPRIGGMQAVGGTCALRLAGELLKLGISSQVAVSDPSWPIHRTIYSRAGLDVSTYRYYDSESRSLNFAGMKEDLEALPGKTAVVLQVACHNPTGLDLSLEQWKELSELVKRKKLLPILDFAYQGFGDGVEEDAAPIRLLAEAGHEMFVCSSCSKNFGLYGERLGHLSVVTQSEEHAAAALSQLKLAQRGMYSTSPIHGGNIVGLILADSDLRQMWSEELTVMRERIRTMRKDLIRALGNGFSFMAQQKGMFSYSGLSPEQVGRLRDEFAIYMPRSGRINVAGLNSHNLQAVVDAFQQVG